MGIFLSRHCRCASYLTRHIIPHIYAPVLLFSSIFEDRKHAALVASRHSKCSGGDVRLFTLSESSRHRQGRTCDVTSNILAQLRRCSCQPEQVRLITHEKILLNGYIVRRNGYVTDSVKRPFIVRITCVPLKTKAICD